MHLLLTASFVSLAFCAGILNCMEHIYFESDGLKLHGVASFSQEKDQFGVVFLHGGGSSSTTRYEYLQNYLQERNVSSFSFDFRGCGKSEGDFADGTLCNRMKDALSAVNYYIKESGINPEQLYLWGSSMGAHIASRICNQLPFRGIILQSPAAYGASTENVLLGPEFTNGISIRDSWRDSLVFPDLEKFEGKFLVVFAKNDEVIPPELIGCYMEIGKRKGMAITLHGGTHSLLSPDNPEKEAAREELAEVGYQFIRE